jgi:imidazolonepropionase-like amidohydrolase
LIVEHNVFVSPTLAVFERQPGDKKQSQDFHVRGFEKMVRFVGMCHEAGAVVVTGSHGSVPHAKAGFAFQREMELLVTSGLTPLEAITASTLNNAHFLGCADRLGSVEEGKVADLVLLDGNPHEQIKAMYDVRRVMLNGQWVRRAAHGD